MPPATSPPTGPVHQGFFLRLHFGGGSNSFSGSGSAGSAQILGGGISFGVAVGSAVAPNLALFGDYFFTAATQASVDTSNTAFSNARDVGIDGFGGGVVYYFEPINLYLSGAIAATFLVLSDAQEKMIDETDTGIGFEGMIGKEWWVSQHWGLGAAGQVVAATRMKGHDVPNVSWSAHAFNLVFSATYY